MVQIPYIKIPSVRVKCIGPASNIGVGGATPAPPTPITYLTRWGIVGNSEVHGNEIWSCGEYNSTDGKYHILVQPQGGSIADIALTEPLRMVNNVADTIQFPSETEGKALVTRNLGSVDLGTTTGKPYGSTTTQEGKTRWKFNVDNVKYVSSVLNNVLSPNYETKTVGNLNNCQEGIAAGNDCIWLYDEDLAQVTSLEAKTACSGVIVLFEHATPITELVDMPQIEEAESYTCVISQDAKAISWYSFTTNSE